MEIQQDRKDWTDQSEEDSNLSLLTLDHGWQSSAQRHFDGNPLPGNSSTPAPYMPFTEAGDVLGDLFNREDISENDRRDTVFGECSASASLCPPTFDPLQSSAQRHFAGNPLPGNSSTPAPYMPLTEAGDVFDGLFNLEGISGNDRRNTVFGKWPASTSTQFLTDPREKICSVAGPKGFVCIDVGKAQGSAELLVYRPTEEFSNVLPPLYMHLKLMHLRADDNGNYKVLVSGMIDTGDSSLINCTMVYSSTTSAWEPCKGNSPSFCPIEYQNGVYDEDRELLFCFAAADEEGSRVVVVYDFKKEQWQDSIKHPVVTVTGSRRKSSSIIPRLNSTQLIGCGGSIILFREQGISGSDEQFFFHKLNPDTLEETALVKDVRPYKGVGGACSGGLGAYPKFDCILGSATLIECAGSVFVISEQEISDERFICIRHLDGDSWKEIHQFKKVGYRGPPFEIDEIDAFFRFWEQALKISKTTPPWKFIADGLKSEGYNRTAKQCEDLVGTLRRERRNIKKFIQNKPTTEVWNMNKDERSRHKLSPRFTERWYYKLEEIPDLKTRSGQKRSQIVNAVRDQDNDSLVTLANSLATSAALPASSAQTPLVLGVKDSIDVEQVEVDMSPGMAAITSVVDSIRDIGGRRDWTNEQVLEIARMKLEEKKLDFQKLQLMEKNKAHEECEEPRPRKPRKRVRRK